MKIQQPKISANLELKELEEIFQDEDDIVEVAKIENANLSNKVLQRFVVYGSYIKDCDFSNTKMDHGSIHRVTFKNCRMTGTLFNYMRFGNIVFDEVKADFISVVDSKIETLMTQKSNFENAEFHNSTLKKVVFDDSNLEHLSIYQTPLKGCDLSQSYFESFVVNKEDLLGCKVSRNQAVQFAALMGLVIVE